MFLRDWQAHNETRITFNCAHLRLNDKKTRPSALGVKIFLNEGEEERRLKRRKIFGDGKYGFVELEKKNKDGKGGKYMEKIFLWKRRRTKKEKAKNVWR